MFWREVGRVVLGLVGAAAAGAGQSMMVAPGNKWAAAAGAALGVGAYVGGLVQRPPGAPPAAPPATPGVL